MKKLLQIRKITMLLLLLLMMAGGVKGQNNCIHAVNITSWNGCNEVLDSANQDTWYTLTADTFVYIIKIFNSNNNPKSKISDISIYNGECDSLIQLLHTESSIEDTMFLVLDSLVPNNEYLIYINRDDSINSFFSFCFIKRLKSNNPSCPPPPCNLLSNGEFNSNGLAIAFYWNEVCGWIDAFGHPDITLTQGNYSAFMWSYEDNVTQENHTEAISQDILLDPLINAYNLTFDWTRYEQINHTIVPELSFFLVDNYFTTLYNPLQPIPANLFQNNTSHWQLIANIQNIPWQSTIQWNTIGPIQFTTPSPNSFTHLLIFPTGPEGISDDQISINIDNVIISPIAPSLIVSANPSTICLGQSTTLSVNGSTNYLWQPGGMTGNSINVSPTSTTIYTVTGETLNGCTSSATITVNVVTLSVNASDSYLCYGESSELSVTGGNSYNWMPGNINATNTIVTPITTTIYTVTENPQGCTETITITVPPRPYVNNPIIDCNDPYGADLCVSGITNGTYYWDNPPLPICTLQCMHVNPTVSSVYHVTVGYDPLCPTVVLTSTVLIPPAPPKPELQYFVNNTCDGGDLIYPYSISNSEPGFEYNWEIIPSNAGTFDNNVNTGTNVTIDWDASNVPVLPDFAIIRVTVRDEKTNCYASEDFHFFECCVPEEFKGGNDESHIILNNTDAQTASNLIPDNTSDMYILINGNFFVNADLSLFGNNFFMGPEAAIIIMPEYDLEIDETDDPSHLHAGCYFMWKGIYADDDQSILVFRNSILSDALIGIEARNNTDLSISSNIFSNNDISVKIRDYINPANGTVSIFGNNFTSAFVNGNISFYPPFDIAFKKPYTGVYVEHCNNIIIGDETQTVNTFYTLHNGIYSKNSDINVYFNEYNNIRRSFGGLTPYIHQPSGAGIYSVRTLPSIPNGFNEQGINIGGSEERSNRFTNCDYGVYLYNNKKFNVALNEFDYNRYGVFAGEINSSKVPGERIIYNNHINHVEYCGIQLQTMFKCQVKYNLIENIFNPSDNLPLSRRYGILSQGGFINTIYGNTIQNTNTLTHTSLRVEGICAKVGTNLIKCNSVYKMGKGLSFYGNLAPSKIELNEMNLCKYGLYLNHGFIGQQGYVNHPSDNKWIDIIDHDAYTENSATVNGYDIYVRNASGIYHPTNIYGNGSDLFTITGTNGSGGFCLPLQDQETVVFALNKEMSQIIAEEEIDYEEYEESNEWMSKLNLYKYLYQVEEDSLTDDWMVKFIEDYDQNDKNLIGINELIDSNEFENAYDLLSATNPQGEPAALLFGLYKEILDAVMIQNNASDNILFYDYQLDILRGISSLCPYEHGSVVYQARLLMSFIEPTVFYNSCEEMMEERKMEKSPDDATIAINVYPNPASNAFAIEFTGDIREQTTHVELYDIYGKLQKKLIYYNEPKITINTQDIAAGVYFYQISINNTNLAKDKIVIIK